MENRLYIAVFSGIGAVAVWVIFGALAIASLYLMGGLSTVLESQGFDAGTFSFFTVFFSLFLFVSGFLAMKAAKTLFRKAHPFALLASLSVFIVLLFDKLTALPSIAALIGAIAFLYYTKSAKTVPKEN